MTKPISVEDVGKLVATIRHELALLRNEVKDVAAQVGMQSTSEKVLSDHDDKILQAINDHQKATDTEIVKIFQVIEQQNKTQQRNELALAHVYLQLSAFNDIQSRLRDLGHIAPLIPIGPFCSRLLGEERHARDEVARHVVQKYFVEPSKKQLCFIQASSLAFDIFHHINAMDGVYKHCLFHVNGPLAALPLQFGQNNGKHCVVPFWGSIFDTNCAAYIPPSSDERALQELRLLFQRQNDPLKLVFLSPRYMTPDAQIFYEKLETVHFVDEMADAIEGRDGTEIIVMVPGARIVPSVDKIPQEFQGFRALKKILHNQADKLTYVVSDTRQALPEFAKSLREHVGRLWWQDSSLQWHDVPYA